MQAQSPDEIFDVVDARDRVIGQATRAEVHAKKLLHRAVHIMVFNAAGEAFLQRRSMQKDTAPGKWTTSAAGHVDSGEDYDSTAIRELGEELGIEASVQVERVVYLQACEQTGHEFVWVYRAQHEGPFVLNEYEVMDGRWIALAELEAWLARAPEDFAESFHYVWKRFKVD